MSARIRVVVAEGGAAAPVAATPRKRKRVQTHTAPKRAVVERRSYPRYRSYPYRSYYGYPRYRPY